MLAAQSSCSAWCCQVQRAKGCWAPQGQSLRLLLILPVLSLLSRPPFRSGPLRQSLPQHLLPRWPPSLQQIQSALLRLWLRQIQTDRWLQWPQQIQSDP